VRQYAATSGSAASSGTRRSPPGEPRARSTQATEAAGLAPAPFSRTGSFLAATGAEPTWTGDLGVSLPGAGLVPLTGPEFDALLCSETVKKKAEACFDELDDLLGLK
jgi:hypothetical protein